jgi:hypothetical protein
MLDGRGKTQLEKMVVGMHMHYSRFVPEAENPFQIDYLLDLKYRPKGHWSLAPYELSQWGLTWLRDSLKVVETFFQQLIGIFVPPECRIFLFRIPQLIVQPPKTVFFENQDMQITSLINIRWIAFGFITCIVLFLLVNMKSAFVGGWRVASSEDFCYHNSFLTEGLLWKSSFQLFILFMFIILLRILVQSSLSSIRKWILGGISALLSCLLVVFVPFTMVYLYPIFSLVVSVFYVVVASLMLLQTSIWIHFFFVGQTLPGKYQKYLLSVLYLGILSSALFWVSSLYSSSNSIIIRIVMVLEIFVIVFPYVKNFYFPFQTFGILVPALIALYGNLFFISKSDDVYIGYLVHLFYIFLQTVFFLLPIFLIFRKQSNIIESFINLLTKSPVIPSRLSQSVSSSSIDLEYTQKEEEMLEILEKSSTKNDRPAFFYDETMKFVNNPTNESSLSRVDSGVDHPNDVDEESTLFLSQSSSHHEDHDSFYGKYSSSARKTDKITVALLLVLGFICFVPWMYEGNVPLSKLSLNLRINELLYYGQICLVSISWLLLWVVYCMALRQLNKVHQNYHEIKRKLYFKHILKRDFTPV